MKIQITFDIDDELADPEHEMGVTDEGYEAIIDALGELGRDFQIRKAE